MAALQTLEGMQELANTLSQDDIPVKLRCATCNKLVINAFRLPCCDQSICEPCQNSLPESCPVCDHSPLSSEDCKPNKSLRLTVKAFLKSEEKKRDKERGASVAKAADTPIRAPSDLPSVPNIDQDPVAANADVDTNEDMLQAETQAGDSNEAVKDAELPETDLKTKASTEPPTETLTETAVEDHDQKQEIDANGVIKETQLQSDRMEGATDDNTEGAHQSGNWNVNGGQQGFGALGFNANQNGYPGMGWSGPGGFNPMGVGMQGGTWNAFPNMMGMPGMGMDPMAMSQGMFGGFGGQSMGMNGMNGMNMGMDYSGGYNNGWSGPMNNGGFGANAGFYPSGGYNQQSHQQGNYAHQMHHQQYSKNNYQTRFHGQGGLQQHGTSREHQNNIGNQSDHHTQEQAAENGAIQPDDQSTKVDEEAQTSPDHQMSGVSGDLSQTPTTAPEQATSKKTGLDDKDEEKLASNSNKDDEPESIKQGESESSTNHDAAPTDGQDDYIAHSNGEAINPSMDPSQPSDSQLGYGEQMQQQTQQIPTFEEEANPYGLGAEGMLMPGQMDAMDPYSYNQSFQGNMPHYGGRGRGRGYGRGGFEYRGGYRGRGGRGYAQNGQYHSQAAAVSHSDVTVLTPGEPQGVGVAGAPTGPKAMREGLPNTGLSGRIVASGNHRVNSTAGHSAELPRDHERSYPEQHMHTRTSSRDRSQPRRSRSKSRSRSRARWSPRREQSRSPSSDHESRKRRRHRSSRKYEDEPTETEDRDRSGASHREYRSRESSVESKHRSRRDKEKHRSRRHRHQSRSRSPRSDAEERINGDEAAQESGDRRRSRAERQKDRRERSRSRDRDRDRDRRRRRERSHEPSEEDRHHRSSRRSRRDRDKDKDKNRSHDYERDRERERDRNRDRERERDRNDHHQHGIEVQSIATKSSSDAAVSHEPELKIHGRARMKPSPISTSNMPPPTQTKSQTPSTFAPPTGPSADRAKRRSSNSVAPPTPLTPSEKSAPNTPAIDQHQEERERRNRERLLKEEQRRASLHGPGGEAKKRSREETEEKAFQPPTGPSAQRNKRHRGSGARRGGWKYDDDDVDEGRTRRGESEREAARWN